MGWLGRGVGDFGSQVGQGYDINLDWKTRLQNLAMQNAKQKLEDLKGPLEVQEIQQRLKQMKSPQPAGIVKGVGGETSGVTFDPATSTYSVKTLIPGTMPEPKFPTLQAAAAYYLQKGDFEKLKLVNDEMDRNKKAAPGPKDAFELWQSQNPGHPIAEWLKLQEQYKKTGSEGKAPSEWDQRIANYLAANGMKDTPANRDKADQAIGVRNRMVPKPIAPDIQNLLTSPVPKIPTAEESRRLADAADRIFGGTAYKQDLMGRGRRTSFPFIGTLGRAPYASVAYDAQEYGDILNSIKSGAARGPNVDFSDVGGTPVQGQ